MGRKVLERSFFEGPTLEVAESVIGKYLCRKVEGGRVIRQMVTEVEAYDGPEDRASHASRGVTERNRVMFGPGGVWYVYLCYGVHWMLNVVTGEEGYPAALLLRGTREVVGPGRLTKAMRVNKDLDGKACGVRSGLWMEESEGGLDGYRLERRARVGIDYAGPEWVSKPYRFILTKE